MLADGCRQNHPHTFWLATLAGPILFNDVPMWIGFFLMRKPDPGTKLFGVSLIFSTIPIMRIVFSLLWIMNLCIWALTLPPLILAWRTLSNRYKPMVYGLFLIGVPVRCVSSSPIDDRGPRHGETFPNSHEPVSARAPAAPLRWRRPAGLHSRSPAARPPLPQWGGAQRTSPLAGCIRADRRHRTAALPAARPGSSLLGSSAV